MRTLHHLILLVCLACGAGLGAQEERQSVSLRAFSYEHPIEGVFVRQGRDYLPLELKPYEPGAPLRIEPEKGVLEFYLADGTSPSTGAGKPQWRRVGTVSVGPEVTSRVLAFVPVPSETGVDPFRILSFDDDARSFPSGAVRVINLSPFPVAVRLGDGAEMLKPAEDRLFAPALDHKNRVHAQFAVRMNEDPTWRHFHQGPLSLRPARRATYLVAFSTSVLVARGEDVATLADGRLAPSMGLVSWQDYLRPPQMAGVR